MKGTNNKVDYIFTSIISAEPRYYYNFNKRIEKGKKILNNSTNYISAELFYVPDILLLQTELTLQLKVFWDNSKMGFS
ncbi:MAG TPA: hypothetical protein ENK67_02820 [Flavobacteriia bacterium]|nr:hypothetical protein [Flavobacteriia bacterium]